MTTAPGIRLRAFAEFHAEEVALSWFERLGYAFPRMVLTPERDLRDQ